MTEVTGAGRRLPEIRAQPCTTGLLCSARDVVCPFQQRPDEGNDAYALIRCCLEHSEEVALTLEIRRPRARQMRGQIESRFPPTGVRHSARVERSDHATSPGSWRLAPAPALRRQSAGA